MHEWDTHGLVLHQSEGLELESLAQLKLSELENVSIGQQPSTSTEASYLRGLQPGSEPAVKEVSAAFLHRGCVDGGEENNVKPLHRTPFLEKVIRTNLVLHHDLLNESELRGTASHDAGNGQFAVVFG